VGVDPRVVVGGRVGVDPRVVVGGRVGVDPRVVVGGRDVEVGAEAEVARDAVGGDDGESVIGNDGEEGARVAVDGESMIGNDVEEGVETEDAIVDTRAEGGIDAGTVAGTEAEGELPANEGGGGAEVELLVVGPRAGAGAEDDGLLANEGGGEVEMELVVSEGEGETGGSQVEFTSTGGKQSTGRLTVLASIVTACRARSLPSIVEFEPIEIDA